MDRPICYYVGRWGEQWERSKNTFCLVAQTSTLELAQTVAAITHREILSDNDPRAENCDWVWDYRDITEADVTISPTAQAEDEKPRSE